MDCDGLSSVLTTGEEWLVMRVLKIIKSQILDTFYLVCDHMKGWDRKIPLRHPDRDIFGAF